MNEVTFPVTFVFVFYTKHKHNEISYINSIHLMGSGPGLITLHIVSTLQVIRSRTMYEIFFNVQKLQKKLNATEKSLIAFALYKNCYLLHFI